MAKFRWTNVAAFAALAIVLFLIATQAPSPLGRQPIEAGTPLPDLDPAGWLNLDEGASPLPADHGPLVVDCWASWCPPCRAEMPRLAELHARYAPLGVTFLGLTSETERDLPKIEKFMQSVPGFTWPVGYGAAAAMDQLGVRALPTLIVFNGEKKVVWSSIGSHDLPDVLDGLLAK